MKTGALGAAMSKGTLCVYKSQEEQNALACDFGTCSFQGLDDAESDRVSTNQPPSHAASGRHASDG
jgi:hypothetical protein